MTDVFSPITCFHCGETFRTEAEARDHFGFDPGCDPACRIKLTERSLVRALRRAEQQAADAWAAIHTETTDAAKAFHAQHARHLEQLRLVEEAAYERGLADGLGGPREEIRAKIMARVRIDPDTGCWIWTGPTSGDTGRGKDYPRMRLRGQTVAVHRVMFINEFGFVPSKRPIDHTCRNRRCVNPEHLEMVTHKENCRRRDEANGVRKRSNASPQRRKGAKT